jgi:hypothetical protein
LGAGVLPLVAIACVVGGCTSPTESRVDGAFDGSVESSASRDGSADVRADAPWPGEASADGGRCCPVGPGAGGGSLGGWSASGNCQDYPDPGLCDGMIGKDDHGCDVWIHNPGYGDYTTCQEAGSGYHADAGDGGTGEASPGDAGDGSADDGSATDGSPDASAGAGADDAAAAGD